jgi:hypothetical protein
MARLRHTAFAALCLAAALWSQLRQRPDELPEAAGFHFLRLEYKDHFQARRGGGRFGGGRGWWMQDFPEAEDHFTTGLARLTRLDLGRPKHLPLTDDRIFDYPWIYATQTGYWDLSDAEIDRLRDYLLRGGFLMTDDFHGPEWEPFAATMHRLFPDRPILDIEPGHASWRVLYDITERTTIPGLRHLRGFRGGSPQIQMPYGPPQWRGIFDDKGRLLVAICYNMDVGDAWEHADMPEYPAEMTGLAYRFGINYILYAITH